MEKHGEHEPQWADRTASKVTKEKGQKKFYACASGITPSGTIHVGNFREIITTQLVAKALEDKGKKVRFIYSWDDYDAFRKVPANVPKKWDQYLGMPLTSVPDPWNCHNSYADHFKTELEESIKEFGFKIEYISQTKQYKSCIYAEEIKKALENRNKIINILDKFREEPLPKDWIPLEVYCEKCNKNNTQILKYDNKYIVHYECECKYSNEVDFRKTGNVKLLWRVDWPMRWHYEKVDFEPGGKDHSVAGGSHDTAKTIVKEVWDYDPPTYLMYDFVRIKGGGGKISSSLGNALTPKEVLEIYEPRVLRWLFVGSRPNSEMAISFDLDVLKIYEDFDKCERIYFDEEKIDNHQEMEKQKRIYELSSLKVPKEIPDQPTFRHLTLLTQIYEGDIKKAVRGLNGDAIKERTQCAWNWVRKYAPEDMRFRVHDELTKEVKEMINEKQKQALILLRGRLKKKNYGNQGLFQEFYSICEEEKIKNTDFFEGAYLALIGKRRGPKLTHLISAIGKKRAVDLLSQL